MTEIITEHPVDLSDPAQVKEAAWLYSHHAWELRNQVVEAAPPTEQQGVESWRRVSAAKLGFRILDAAWRQAGGLERHPALTNGQAAIGSAAATETMRHIESDRSAFTTVSDTDLVGVLSRSMQLGDEAPHGMRYMILELAVANLGSPVQS